MKKVIFLLTICLVFLRQLPASAQTIVDLNNPGNFNLKILEGQNGASADLNGDGKLDLITGMNESNGVIRVYYGNCPPRVSETISQADAQIVPTASGGVLGSVLLCNDINADGFSDIITSAAYQNVAGGAGRVTIKLGSATTFSGSINDTSCDISLYGSTLLGFAVTVGDVNGDGQKDLIVGASADETTYVILNQRLLSGKKFFDMADTASYDFAVVGTGNDARYGSGLTAGDINGDAIDDLLIAGIQDYNYSGGIFIFYGASSFSQKTYYLSTTTHTQFKGSAGFLLGIALDIKDINNDGAVDLLFGAIGTQFSFAKYGPFSFSPGIIDLSLSSNYDIYFNNLSFPLIGDFNNNGINDYIFTSEYADYGSRQDAGAVYVVFDTLIVPPSKVVDRSDLNTSGVLCFVGSSVQSGITRLSADQIVDYNGDGVKDILMSEISGSGVYVVYGIKTFFSSGGLSPSRSSGNPKTSKELLAQIQRTQPNAVKSNTVAESKASLPKEYNLSQNYPNPFNPTTIIGYQLPKSGFVTLKVFDILGREIASLVNERKEAGAYQISFNASRLASGTYFYRLQVDGYTQTKELQFLK